MSLLGFRTTAVLAVLAGLSMAAPAWSQEYHDQIYGVATVCGVSKTIDQYGDGPLSGKAINKQADCQGSAEVDAVASMNPSYFSIHASAGSAGGGAITTGIILDTVTFTPPAGYSSSSVKLFMVAQYSYEITGTVPAGNTPVYICYRAIGATCFSFEADTGLVITPFHTNLTAKKNASGIFSFEFSVTGGVSSNIGGESKLVSNPVSFLCPAAGWTYTLASAGSVEDCNVGP